jgi:hypothetical protein
MSSNVVRFDSWRSLDFGSIGASYTTIGTPLGHLMRVLQFINNTDGDIAVSFNGVTDNVPCIANSFALYDLTSDQDSGESFRYQINTQLYVKYITAPTTGTFYIVAIYGAGE